MYIYIKHSIYMYIHIYTHTYTESAHRNSLHDTFGAFAIYKYIKTIH